MAPIGICDIWPEANEKMMATANISGNHKGMTLEAFAETHALPPRWLALRKSCEEIPFFSMGDNVYAKCDSGTPEAPANPGRAAIRGVHWIP